MRITVDGIRGELFTPTDEAARELVLNLLEAGYAVRVGGLRVGLCYGPGYNYAVWCEGPNTDQRVGE